MKTTKIILISLFLILLTAFATYSIWILNQPVPEQLQGVFEAKQIKIGSKLTGRIDTLAVEKGDEVIAGQLLYRIECPEIDAKIAQANALKKAAMAINNKAKNGAQKQDIQAAYNTYLKADAAAQFAVKTYNRIESLYNAGVVPEQKKDEVQMQMIAANETAKAAKAIYKKALEGAREEDRQAALAKLEQAEALLAEVSTYFKEKEIIAFKSGEIANIIAEEGELVSQGFPVITLQDLNTIKATFHVKEEKLAYLKKGDVIKASIPALNNKVIDLQVTFISPLGDFATYNATKTRGDFDMRSFEIEAKPCNMSLKLRPGMTALVDFNSIKQSL